jgi:hypothetical protein
MTPDSDIQSAPAVPRRESSPHGPEGSTAQHRPAAPVSVHSVLTPPAVLLLWLIGVVSGRLSPHLEPVSAWLSNVGEVLLVVLLLHAVHEAGHVVAGLAVRVPFDRLTLAVFTISREEQAGGWRLRCGWNRVWRKAAGCVERDVTPAPGIRRALTVTALGGPAASIAVGALLSYWPDPWHGVGLVSVIVGVLNVVPIACLGQLSDGMLVFRLWSRSPAHVAWRAALGEPEPAPARAGSRATSARA